MEEEEQAETWVRMFMRVHAGDILCTPDAERASLLGKLNTSVLDERIHASLASWGMRLTCKDGQAVLERLAED